MSYAYNEIVEEDKNYLVLEDDTKEPILPLATHRVPWLIIGLIGGILTTIVSSKFENLLSSNINLVFFIPVIVYMADALGTQTETIYVRNLARRGKDNLSLYFFKELFVGISLGLIFGLIIGLFAYLWFGSYKTALIVTLAMFASMTIAPAVALFVPTILQKEHYDPALGAGPFTTVLQDLISLSIYLLVASTIILS